MEHGAKAAVTTVKRRLEWDSAHRVLRHESKCSTLHGHRYVALIEATAPHLDTVGRVIDFGVIKSIVGTWIDSVWDHTTLINVEDVNLLEFCSDDAREGKRPPYVFDCEPTAENIARVLFEACGELLANTEVTVTKVEVFETPNCSATYERRPA